MGLSLWLVVGLYLMRPCRCSKSRLPPASAAVIADHTFEKVCLSLHVPKLLDLIAIHYSALLIRHC